MRLVAATLLCVLLTACSGIQPVAASNSDDEAKWQGTWKLVSSTFDGQQQTAELRWVVSGDRYNIMQDGRLGQDPYKITLNAAKGRVDVFHHNTPQGMYGGSYKGIYKISGNSLTVCYDLSGAKYPSSFGADKGSARTILQFQRER